MDECRAVLEGGRLVLENSCIRRVYIWNEGHLIGRQIIDLQKILALCGPGQQETHGDN